MKNIINSIYDHIKNIDDENVLFVITSIIMCDDTIDMMIDDYINEYEELLNHPNSFFSKD